MPTPIVKQMYNKSSLSVAKENVEMVPKEEFNKLKRKLEEVEPELAECKRRLKEAEAELEKEESEDAESNVEEEEAEEDKKKLKQFEALKQFVAENMQIRQEKLTRARISLTLADFATLSTQEGFNISSDPVEVAGFKWKLCAFRYAKGAWMDLYLNISPPKHYIGQFEFEVDCSFHLLNTSFISKDVQKRVADCKIAKGRCLYLDQGLTAYRLDRTGSVKIREFVEIKDLADPKSGFLRNGSIQLEVDFIVKSAKFDPTDEDSDEEGESGDEVD